MELLHSFILYDRVEVRILRGDLTQSNSDAIVNAANEMLQHGAGVAGAIARHGGRVIQTESNNWVRDHGPITHDKPALTTCGDLPCKTIIHVVGPRWGEGDEDRKLKRAITAALDMAQQKGFESIAFPAISTGIFGFPKEQAAQVIVDAIDEFIESVSEMSLQQIDLVLFDRLTADAFIKAARERWS